MAVKVLRVFQEFTSAGYVPMPIAGNIDYGVTVANTFPATTPATFQTDDPDIEVNVTEVTDFYVWIRSHGTAWNYLYTRNVRVYPDSPTINNVVMGIIIARLTDAVPYTGATQDTDLGEFGLKAGWLGLDLTPTNTPTDVGTISWDDQDGTANLVLKGGNVNLQIGQEQVTRVVNKTGASLLEANYQAVRISGAQGNRLKVSLAQANNDANSADTIGLVTETIANNEEGFVTTSGLVKGIDTTGSLQSETWVDGDVLYLSGTTAGMITNVKPQAPTHTVIIGYVVRAHATQGQIYVKVDNGYELDELHNVRITTPTDKDFLIYDGTNQYWKNRDLFGTTGYLPVYDTTSLLKDSIIYTDGTAIGIGTNVLQSGAVATFGDVAHFTENISLADSKGIVSGGVNMLSRNNLNNQIIIGADGGINDNVAFYSGDLERMRLLANGRLAINKTTASYQVDVQGDVNVSGAFRVNGTIIPNGTVTSVAMSVPTGLVISGSPITSSGTLAVTYAVNYGIPTLTKQSDWDDAYTWVTNFPDQLGNSSKFLTTNGSALSWASLVTGVSSVFGRTGAVVAQSGDYTTAQVTESGNLYYTDARARLALSGGTGITYNNTTGVIAYSGTVYTDSSIRALFSAGAGISYNNTTGVITSTITQYTDVMARASLSFVAGSGAYNSTTGVITIPTNTNQLTNGASFITLASLSASAPLSYNNGTGAFSISQASGSTNGFLSSTDWNTFNNKQNALGYTPVPTTRTLTINGTSYDLSADRSWTIASGIGGSGTTNYIPKFTASTTIGNSNLQEASGNLGLGVTPQPWTSVHKVIQFGAIGSIETDNDAVAVSNNRYFDGVNRYSANDFASIYVQVNGQHVWYTAPSGTAGTAISFTQAMTLDASGNLVIGGTSASYRLQVEGVATAGFVTSIVAKNPSTNAASSVKIGLDAGGTIWGEVGASYNSNNPYLALFVRANAEKLRIWDSGNVSIGNTNNTYKLDVSGEAMFRGDSIYAYSGDIQLGRDTTYSTPYMALGFGGRSNGYNKIYAARDTTDGIFISSATGRGIYLQTNGASTNALTLSYTGAATFSSSVTAGSNVILPSGYELVWGSGTPASILGVSGASGYLALYTNNSEKVRITSTGNVSIGNTNNTYKLDVSGTVANLNNLIYSGGSLFLRNPSNTFDWALYHDGSNNLKVDFNGANRLLINSGGAATFSSSVTASTLNAISTLSGASLNISGTQSTFRIASNYTGGGDLLSGTLMYIDDVVNNNLTIIPSSAGTNGSKIVAAAYNGSAWRSMWEFANTNSGNPNLILVKSGGNVGIGTTSPDRPLDIYNASAIALARVRSNNNNGAALTIQNDENGHNVSIYSVGSAGFGISGWANNALIESLTGIVYSAYNGNHIFQSGVNARTERMRITSGGQIYMGNSAGDGYRLQIFGTNQAGSTFGQTYIGVAAYSQWVNSSGAFVMGLDGASGTTERMRITSGGNVGIGTTSPNAKLQVAGNINIFDSGGSDRALFVSQAGGATTVQIHSNGFSYFNGGSVGIGTSTPTQALTIQKSGYPIIDFYDGATGRGDIGFNTATSSFNIGAYGAIPMVFYVNSSERMRITSGGDVNIGSSPSTGYKFNVRNASGNYLSFWSPTIGGVATNGFLSHNGGGFNSQVSMGYNATVHVFNGEVTGGGLVQVAGDVNISGAFKINGTAIGTGGGGVSGSGTTNYLAKWTSGTSLSNSNILDTGSTIYMYTNTSASNVQFYYESSTWGTGTNHFRSSVFPLALDGSTIYFSNGGTQRMYLNSSGSRLFTGNGNLDTIGSTASGGVSIVRFDSTTGIGYDAETIHVFYTAGTEIARFNTGGELLLGTTTDNGAYKLQVNSQIWATNATIATSDVRLKDNIQDISNALSVIMGLKPRTFTYKQDKGFNFGKFTNTGFIAQEIKESMTGLNYLDSIVLECGNYYGVAYEKFIPILTKGIQEQQVMIETNAEKIARLEKETSILKEEIKQLKGVN